MTCRYGRKSWALWGQAVDWRDCKEALASIGRVAQDTIDRLQAEFRSEDLYLAYQAFGLDTWEVHFSGGVSTPAVVAKRQRLKAAAKAMCHAFSVPFDMRVWIKAATASLQHRPSLESTSRPSSPSLDSRCAWRGALDAGLVPEPLRPLVRFYMATWDGTGTVERGLGSDAAIMKQHVGNQTRAGADASLYSNLLELKLDGPQREQDVFASDGQAGGALIFTEFSRSCAALWLALRGRRFSCYKPRCDQGGQ